MTACDRSVIAFVKKIESELVVVMRC